MCDLAYAILSRFRSKIMKIGFIATYYNEEGSLKPFLNSLFSQSLMPTEIILVDAYSTDNSLKVLKRFLERTESRKKVSVKLLRKKGNRSIGRNFAISNSRCDVIVCSDVGCLLDKDWLKKIVQPFKDRKIDVVAGFYKPLTDTIFEKCVATYTCVPEDKVTIDFLPSSRSIAFRRRAWEAVSGYPEKLNTCEDLVFARNLKNKKFKFVVRKDAVVYWEQRKNLKDAFVQFYNYALGDGEALYFRKQTPLLFLRYIAGIGMVSLQVLTQNFLFLLTICILTLSYFIWAVHKNYKYVIDPRAVLYLPLLQISSDLAILMGMTTGLVKRFLRK